MFSVLAAFRLAVALRLQHNAWARDARISLLREAVSDAIRFAPGTPKFAVSSEDYCRPLSEVTRAGTCTIYLQALESYAQKPNETNGKTSCERLSAARRTQRRDFVAADTLERV